MGHTVESILGSFTGANDAKAAADQASGAENSLIQNGILPIDQTLLNNYTNNVQPVQNEAGGVEASLGNVLGNGNLSGIISNFMKATANPTATDAATGINGTGITGAGLDFYGNEAANGISPQYVNSALANQENQNLTNINSVRNSLGGALNNPQGTINDMNYQNNNATLGLLGNLGAQDQGIKNSAMSSFLSTGNNAESTALANMNSGINTGDSTLSALLSYLGTGTDGLNTALGSYGGLAGAYGSAAGEAAKTAGSATASGNQMLLTALGLM